jgi:hypothetical protein
MRSFVASLLQSDLNVEDLRSLADELVRGSFSFELAETIHDVIGLTEMGRSRGNLNVASPDVPQAYELITRRRLSKKLVSEIMLLASPWIKNQKVQGDGTVKDLLERYFAIAPSSEARTFLSLLRGESSDPYLKGISRRT